MDKIPIESKNIAYIDGQNLYMGTTKIKDKWHIDLARFRQYLKYKYKVYKAYYYLGYAQETSQATKLYEEIQSAGFILVFRLHNSSMIGQKKGNVDSDIIFSIMKRILLKEIFNNIILVSGDGDYKMLVDFLIEQNKFEKILFPNKKYSSSLYKSLSNRYFSSLDSKDIKKKIKKKREP